LDFALTLVLDFVKPTCDFSPS